MPNNENSEPVLSWPAAKFRAAIRAALVAASTDKERPGLCVVQLQRENGVVRLTSTDGHWLFRWTETEGQTDEEGKPINRAPFECRIARRVLESFVDATKKHIELERVTLTGEGHRWELATIMDVRRHEFLQTPEPYPDTDRVIPKAVAPTVSAIGVGANLISSVSKAFALATGIPDVTIYWQMSGGAESPLVCTCPQYGELLAVVMPRRIAADENAVPEKAAAE
jgi:DNA polymerase III sliding clamp (beta) subunit (PCNA family)